MAIWGVEYSENIKKVLRSRYGTEAELVEVYTGELTL